MKSILPLAAALSVIVTPAVAAKKVCAECVAANMARLAGPDARGRACGTADENAAARFVAERLKAYRVKGAATGGAYLQPVAFRTPTYAQPPALTVGDLVVKQGEGMVVLSTPPTATGPLSLVENAAAPGDVAGKILIFDAVYDPRVSGSLLRAGALAVVVPVTDQVRSAWRELSLRPPPGVEIEGVPATATPARPVIFATPETLAQLKARVGQSATLSAPRGPPVAQTSYNVLGVIRGTAPDADKQAILLSAHYDHVGVKDGVLYPGANDDASGTAAVLEFARLLGAGAAPKRTVMFALFGCEEQGGHGAKLFLAQPPLPLTDIVANLEFEMIGLPDPNHPKTLMLTGWERSNLGPTLKAQGADIGPDPYPEQNFFQRSDNYQLALKGVVAQTVSAWPVPPTYHQPTDTVESVDLPFMAEVIQSLVKPIDWLANNDFRPAWNPGGQP